MLAGAYVCRSAHSTISPADSWTCWNCLNNAQAKTSQNPASLYDLTLCHRHKQSMISFSSRFYLILSIWIDKDSWNYRIKLIVFTWKFNLCFDRWSKFPIQNRHWNQDCSLEEAGPLFFLILTLLSASQSLCWNSILSYILEEFGGSLQCYPKSQLVWPSLSGNLSGASGLHDTCLPINFPKNEHLAVLSLDPNHLHASHHLWLPGKLILYKGVTRSWTQS